MFPSGMAGVALLFFRLSVAATMLVDGTRVSPQPPSGWILSVIIVTSVFLCIGLLTPYFSCLCCFWEVRVLVTARGGDEFHLVIAILNAIILAILGPGENSLDARIFGRRLLSLPPRRKDAPSKFG